MSLRDKYQQAINLAMQCGMKSATVKERDGKLVLEGTVHSDADRKRILEAVRAQPGWENEVLVDVRAAERAPTRS